MKMSDVFALPVFVDCQDDIEISSGAWLYSSERVTFEQLTEAAHAINMYDDLVVKAEQSANDMRIAATNIIKKSKNDPHLLGVADMLKRSASEIAELLTRAKGAE